MLPKLNLICSKDELRPALCCVQISRKDLRATDTTCLAIIPTEKTALAECGLPEKPVYLHREAYKLLTAPSIAIITFDSLSDQFIAYHKGAKPETVVPLTKMGERYPDFEPLLPRWNDTKDLNTAAVNPRLLLNLAEAIAEPGQKNLGVSLRFTDKYPMVLVKAFASDLASAAAIMALHHTQNGDPKY